jgi:uncharacterized protein (DUF302 family)
MIRQALVWACIVILGCVPRIGFAADPPGLVTVASNNSVAETIQRFEDAIKSKGWMVFARLDHAAAAEKYEQKLLPRTVIVFGNPRTGTANMVKAPTLAIDLPPKALVWQDDQGKVWLSSIRRSTCWTQFMPATAWPRSHLTGSRPSPNS